MLTCLLRLDVCLQGGAVIRASRRTVERVGFDPATGLHLENAPLVPEPVVLEDCKLLTQYIDSPTIHVDLVFYDRFKVSNIKIQETCDRNVLCISTVLYFECILYDSQLKVS